MPSPHKELAHLLEQASERPLTAEETARMEELSQTAEGMEYLQQHEARMRQELSPIVGVFAVERDASAQISEASLDKIFDGVPNPENATTEDDDEEEPKKLIHFPDFNRYILRFASLAAVFVLGLSLPTLLKHNGVTGISPTQTEILLDSTLTARGSGAPLDTERLQQAGFIVRMGDKQSPVSPQALHEPLPSGVTARVFVDVFARDFVISLPTTAGPPLILRTSYDSSADPQAQLESILRHFRLGAEP